MKLLVTTDGSDRSLRVLPHAGLLARSLGGDLILTRVLDPRQDVANDLSPTVGQAVENVKEIWQNDLEAVLETRGIDGNVHIAVRQGATDISDCILDVARQLQVAAIAMDNRGRGALRQAMFGSVSMGVLKDTEVPIFVTGDGIQDPPAQASPYHIVVADDGSQAASTIFRDMQGLLVPGRTRITLLNVYEPSSSDSGRHLTIEAALAHLEKLREQLPQGVESAVHVEEVAKLGGIDSAIVAFATRVGANAIAFATHGHSARRHLLAGSTALGAVRQSPIPVILERSTN